MGDHFVLLVDRLLTESTLEAAIENRNPSKQLVHPENDDTMIDCSSQLDSESGFSPRKVVECRICQDEDFDSKMETPCSCCDSLKTSGIIVPVYIILRAVTAVYNRRRQQGTDVSFTSSNEEDDARI